MTTGRPETELDATSHQRSAKDDPAQGDAFWAFALDLYSDRLLADACLHLQDACSADGPTLILTLWLAKNGHALDLAELRSLNGGIEPWRNEVVKALRQTRRHLKTASEKFDRTAVQELRRMVKRDELEAERIQMALLSGLCPVDVRAGMDCKSIAALARDNLAGYQALLSEKLLPADIDVLIERLVRRGQKAE